MSAHQKLTPQSAQDVTAKYCPGYCAHGEEHTGPCTAPNDIPPQHDVTAIVMSLPMTAQLTLMLAVLNGRDFNCMDGDEIDRATVALTSLQSQSREMDYCEDRALHGVEVMA